MTSGGGRGGRFTGRFGRKRRAAAPANPEPDSYWGHGGDYHAWVDFLRRWTAEEDHLHPEALPVLTETQFAAETLARLTTHLGDALDARLQAWSDRLVAALNAARDEFSAGRELTQARTGLRAIRAMARHQGLPAGVRDRLGTLVDEQIALLQDQLEQGLEDSAWAGVDPRLVEHRRRTLRENALTEVTQPPPDTKKRRRGAAAKAADAARADPDPWSHDPAARPRRRVIPD
ncbi:hypothetical protein ACIBKX_20885 [Streptomyces sp. NPDC050658]|uniref:hypothetical protein n=1 Tax=unclassified Streptomyces TaxID=2593676 RepID=UPI0034416867